MEARTHAISPNGAETAGKSEPSSEGCISAERHVSGQKIAMPEQRQGPAAWMCRQAQQKRAGYQDALLLLPKSDGSVDACGIEDNDWARRNAKRHCVIAPRYAFPRRPTNCSTQIISGGKSRSRRRARATWVRRVLFGASAPCIRAPLRTAQPGCAAGTLRSLLKIQVPMAQHKETVLRARPECL